MAVLSKLSWRQKCTYATHLFKALFRQHHTSLIPIFKKFIPTSGIIIDIGGHAGQFSKIFSALVPQGRVYTFEPGTYAHSILKKVHLLKRLTNVSIFKMGASDKNGKSVLSVPIKSSGSIGFGRSSINGEDFTHALREEIPLTTLDHFSKTHQLPRVDLIKIDVEGHEMSVLNGAQKLLKDYAPAVMIEINHEHLLKAGTQPLDIFNFFKSLGYHYGRIDEDTGTLLLENTSQIYDTDYLFYKE